MSAQPATTPGTAALLTDTAFPQLGDALDMQRMAVHLATLLISPRCWRIRSCQLERMRYRPGVRCVLHYQLTLQHRDGRQHQAWLQGHLFADSGKVAARLRRLHRFGTPRVHGEPLARYGTIDALGMLIQRFPTDYRLPELARGAQALHLLLETHCPNLFGEGRWRLLTLDSQPIRWRAGLAAVIESRILAVNREHGIRVERNFYTKFTTPNSAAVAPPSGTGRNALPFRTAPCVYRDARHAMSIHMAAPGQSLQQLLVNRRATHLQATQLGSMLARWQVAGTPLRQRREVAHIAARSERLASVLTAAHPAGAPLLGATLERIQLGIHERVHRPGHLDLKPDHIYFHDDQVTLIDLESAADADPALDIGHLLARLAFAQPLYEIDRFTAQRFAVQFYASYRSRVPARWLDNLPYYYAWSTLQAALHMFEHQKPDWPEWVALMLDHAAAASRLEEEPLAWLTALPSRQNTPHFRTVPPGGAL